MSKGVKLKQEQDGEPYLQQEKDEVELNNINAGSIIFVPRIENFKRKLVGKRANSNKLLIALAVLACVWIVGYVIYESVSAGATKEEKIVVKPPEVKKIEKEQGKKKEEIVIVKEQAKEKSKIETQVNWETKQISQDPTQTFEVQKNFWLFHAENHRDLLSRLSYENNKYFAKKSGFKVQVVSAKNREQFMSEESAKRLRALGERLQSKPEAASILSYLSFLIIIVENGGIMATDYFCLTETFDWLRGIKHDLHARRGQEAVDAQVVTFFDNERSSPSVKERINVRYETEKYMRIFPGIDPYFIAAKKGCRFLKDVTNEIFSLFTNDVSNDNKYTLYGTSMGRLSTDYFTIATHRVLQRKQQELDEQFKTHKYRILAVDHYSLYYLNNLGSLRKLFAMTGDSRQHVTFHVMGRYVDEEWRELFGPLRHLARITPHDQMNRFIEELMDRKRDPIIKGSFLQKTLFPQGNFSFIIDNPEKPFVNETSEPWTALPKKIWAFWDSGIQNAPLANQLCVQLMRIRGKQSGFELNIVSKANMRNFISKENMDRIEDSLRNPKVQTFPQSISDLVRLAVLLEHGGVYFDVSYGLLTNLDWLVNIGKYPSHFICNRYGHLPKVVFHYHPQWGGILDWKVDPVHNTKVQWALPYENNFIAAEKGAELIRDWFNQLLKFYHQPYGQTNAYMRSQGLVDMWNSAYLMPMDTLMATVGKKEKEIKANPSSQWADGSDYYKIWSLNGYAGFQKFRDRTGFQSFINADNTFVYRYSQDYVKAYLGSNFNLIKFYGQQNMHMSNFIANNRGSNFSSQAHPQSIFMRYYNHKDIPYYFQGRYKIRHSV